MPQKSAVPRSDVTRNRAALVRSARELLAADKDIPLYEIARHAGVGQATLYRHFPDRLALAAAVVEEIFDELTSVLRANTGQPDALHILMQTVSGIALTDGGLASLLATEAANHQDFARLKSRLLRLIAAPLRDAKAAGVVRPDLTANDVALLLRMVVHAGDEPSGALSMRQRSAATRRALELVWCGVALSAAGNQGR